MDNLALFLANPATTLLAFLDNNFFGYSLEYPYFLWLFVLFVLFVNILKPKKNSIYFPHIHNFPTFSIKSSLLVLIIKWLSILSLIIAISSPIKEIDTQQSKGKGIDILLALDTSGSMEQRGFNRYNPLQTRWDTVASIVKDFIKKRVNDNIGIIVFGDNVMIASPLSYDKRMQSKVIDRLRIGIVGKQTALLDSIAMSIDILSTRDTKSKVIIALSDGEDTASKTPLGVVQKLLKKYDITIYTIGIGNPNIQAMQALSAYHKGESFIANSKQGLSDIYDTINKLEKSNLKQNKFSIKEYYYHYFAWFAFIGFVIIFILNRGAI